MWFQTMQYNLNKKATVILGLILVISCLSSIIFIYYKQSNKSKIEQEIVVVDPPSIVTNTDDRQVTLLGEISQQELKFETNGSIEIKPETEPINSEVVETSQKQQPTTTTTSVTTEEFAIDEEVSAQKSTGADLESSKLSDEEELQWEQIWALRFVTPVKKNSFEIDFNSKSRLFEATLRSNTAKDDLQSWLVKNNFSQIPETSFLYIIAY